MTDEGSPSLSLYSKPLVVPVCKLCAGVTVRWTGVTVPWTGVTGVGGAGVVVELAIPSQWHV